MPAKKDKDGARYVEASVEVPGSPEEVWRAIATGPGISSWFMPSRSDERVGGEAACSFGPGMDAVVAITAWSPPHSFTTETEEGPGNVATQWTVEARAGGTCTVRVVHRWFADNDDWDGEFEGHAYGWATSFFRMLRLYLTHFPGQPCSVFLLSAVSQAPPPQTWRVIKDALRVDEKAARVESAPGTAALSGVVERMEITDPELKRVRETSPQVAAALQGMEGEEPELLLRLDRPAPGLAHIFVVPMGGPTAVSMRVHLYGDAGAAAAGEAEREWSAWLAEQFPPATPEESE